MRLTSKLFYRGNPVFAFEDVAQMYGAFDFTARIRSTYRHTRVVQGLQNAALLVPIKFTRLKGAGYCMSAIRPSRHHQSNLP